jgi:hypothetical protein
MSKKIPLIIKLITILFLLFIFYIIFAGCGKQGSKFSRTAQDDFNPPVFSNLIFPDDEDILSEGKLKITGTLVDDTGFDPEEPVSLEVDVHLADSQIKTFKMVLKDGSPQDYSYFDFNTGDFRFNFDDVQRFKPGRFDLRLTGMDSSGNGVVETAGVTSTENQNVDPTDLYEARANYGEQMLNFFDNIEMSLNEYGDYYSYDIRLLEIIKQFLLNTYISSPERISSWTVPMNEFVQDVETLPVPDTLHPNYFDYLEIKPFVVLAAQELQSWLEITQDKAAYPWYPRNSHSYQIPELRAKPISQYGNLISASYDPLNHTCDIQISCVPPPFPEELWNVADFTINSDPGSQLSITGYIGYEGNRITISPEHYDPPIRLFNLFYETAVDYQMVVKIF